jgi:flavin reductase (DIM6/NTAB) family NADH-FMN oxidoreductase RutF
MDTTAAAALFASLDREVWLVTARAGERRGGLIATFVNQASLSTEQPRVVIGIARQHHTWELIEASNAFALHLLGAGNVDWVPRFGLRSGRDVDKLANWSYRTASTGSPVLDETVGWLDCRVEARLHTGDRTLYLGQVLEGRVNLASPPLTVRQLLASLVPDDLAEMKRLLNRDAQIDAEAIRTWREQQGIKPLGQQLQ